MASIRVEAITFGLADFGSSSRNPTDNVVVNSIGTANRTASVTSTSSEVYGPAAIRQDVKISAYGSKVLLTKGAQGVAANDANSVLIDDGGFILMKLDAGDFLNAKTILVS